MGDVQPPEQDGAIDTANGDGIDDRWLTSIDLLFRDVNDNQSTITVDLTNPPVDSSGWIEVTADDVTGNADLIQLKAVFFLGNSGTTVPGVRNDRFAMDNLNITAPFTSCDEPGGSCRVFVTSVLYPNGNLGGLAGADAKCQALADAASLGGTYHAWLSTRDATGDITPNTSFTQSTVPYVLVGGAPIANSYSDLITMGNPSTEIVNTEAGISLPFGQSVICQAAIGNASFYADNCMLGARWHMEKTGTNPSRPTKVLLSIRLCQDNHKIGAEKCRRTNALIPFATSALLRFQLTDLG